MFRIYHLSNGVRAPLVTSRFHLKVLDYLPEANAAAAKSRDRSTKVGAVALDPDYNLILNGRNGFPRRVDDSVEERYERPLKYLWTAHAEENLVAQAARIGVSLRGCSVIITSLHPCTTCSRMLIQAGVNCIYAPLRNSSQVSTWDDEAIIAMQMLEEAGVKVFYYEEVEDDQQIGVLK